MIGIEDTARGFAGIRRVERIAELPEFCASCAARGKHRFGCERTDSYLTFAGLFSRIAYPLMTVLPGDFVP